MPDETFVRSMLGAQSIAHKDSAPAFGFGSSTREQRDVERLAGWPRPHVEPWRDFTLYPSGAT